VGYTTTVQFNTAHIRSDGKKYIWFVSIELVKHLHVLVLILVYIRCIANGKRKRNNFPTAAELAQIARAVRSTRGSVVKIAARVRRRDGGIGVAHSAVSRTLSGYERNRPVIRAVMRFLRRRGDRFDVNGYSAY
jgi:hypothetical protein